MHVIVPFFPRFYPVYILCFCFSSHCKAPREATFEGVIQNEVYYDDYYYYNLNLIKVLPALSKDFGWNATLM